ncbi:hypothetical protein, partial [Piscinibacter terrae]|uniref:hypothetical protein n=1 Tax=Piscinibacter terrae TaxID=2496871 RepID=UPI001C103B4E
MALDVGVPISAVHSFWIAAISLPAALSRFERVRDIEGLTFDMSGMWKQAKPAGTCPLDGKVRRQCERRSVFDELPTS